MRRGLVLALAALVFMGACSRGSTGGQSSSPPDKGPKPSTEGDPFPPPAPGVYEYTVDRGGQMGSQWTEYGEADEVQPKVFEQTSWTTDSFETQGLRFGRAAWYPNGVFGLSHSVGVGEPPCIFTSLVLSQPRHIEVGDSWETSVRCRGDDEDLAPHSGSSEVVRKETLTIDGIDVETFIIRSEGFFNARNLRVSNEGESWYSPTYKLSLKSDIVAKSHSTDAQFSGGSPGTRFIKELVSLTPSQEPLETFSANTGR